MRDLTKKQFNEACRRRGFVSTGFLGYYRLPGNCGEVSVYNAGKNRRQQLAYLIRCQHRFDAFRSNGKSAK